LIYIVWAVDTNIVKIGYTTNEKSLKNRIEAIQTHSHDDVCLLGVSEGTMDDEKELHREFSSYKKRGEWFRVMPDKNWVSLLDRFLLNGKVYDDVLLAMIDFWESISEKTDKNKIYFNRLRMDTGVHIATTKLANAQKKLIKGYKSYKKTTDEVLDSYEKLGGKYCEVVDLAVSLIDEKIATFDNSLN
jgi:hypothetical protein